MEEWQVVATLDRSDGNESVGEMWIETAVFDQKTPVFEIMKWAASVCQRSAHPQIESLRANLRLTIAQ